MTVIASVPMRRFLATLAAGATAFALMTAAAAVPTRAAGSDGRMAPQPALATTGNRAGIVTVQHHDRPRHGTGGVNRDGDRWFVPGNPPPRAHAPRPLPPHAHAPRPLPPKAHGPRHHAPRPVVLPAFCAVQVSGRHGPHIAYIARCLHREGIDRNLPRRCEMPVRLRGKRVGAYDQNCLINAGFRVQGRHRY
ncbi:MAG: hypothetical protein ACK4RN_14070 [Pseudorhodobacter sp.]